MKRFFSIILSLCLAIGVITAATPVAKTKAATVPSNANLLNTYGNVIPHVGTALVASEILNSTILNYAAKEYNSITVGNEMKPDYVLSNSLISVSQAKALGYYIPDGYTESTVPTLNFTTVDNMMKACYEKGLDMRGHTLLWHAQTPDWYFRTGYSRTGSYVSQTVMNKRMEFFIKSYLGHCCASKYSEIIYAWDVVNEYLHASADKSGWQKIYGNNLGPKCAFVKQAFEYAYDTLSYYGLTNKVSLFYNDYNEYMEVDDIITLINYVNSSRKICAGIGMQSHLSTSFPSVAYYKSALQAFAKAGFEIQITELDAGCTDFTTQATYYYNLMKAILDVKKSGGNITALIWWGMTDNTSWRSSDKPLLYSDYNTKKAAYTSVLQAYFDAGYSMGGGTTTPTSTPTSTPNPGIGSTVKLTDGWYYIKNVNAQKYL
ncbi:endo-1,4-beta-xylanase, partial [Anaeromicropila populeti]